MTLHVGRALIEVKEEVRASVRVRVGLRSGPGWELSLGVDVDGVDLFLSPRQR